MLVLGVESEQPAYFVFKGVDFVKYVTFLAVEVSNKFAIRALEGQMASRLKAALLRRVCKVDTS